MGLTAAEIEYYIRNYNIEAEQRQQRHNVSRLNSEMMAGCTQDAGDVYAGTAGNVNSGRPINRAVVAGAANANAENRNGRRINREMRTEDLGAEANYFSGRPMNRSECVARSGRSINRADAENRNVRRISPEMMAGGNQNHSCTQDASDAVPGSSGRPLAPDSCASDEISGSPALELRPHHVLAQSTALDHEELMARNKQIALQCLRAEIAANEAASCAQSVDRRAPQAQTDADKPRPPYDMSRGFRGDSLSPLEIDPNRKQPKLRVRRAPQTQADANEPRPPYELHNGYRGDDFWPTDIDSNWKPSVARVRRGPQTLPAYVYSGTAPVQRLRVEEIVTHGPQSCSQSGNKRPTQTQRDADKPRPTHGSSGSLRGSRFNIRSNVRATVPVGRHLNLVKDFNMRQPKRQQASSGPRSMRNIGQYLSVPRSANACPQIPAPKYPAPSRSPNASRSTSPTCPNNGRIQPATPTIIPPTPPRRSPCNLTVTTTTRTTALPITPPQKQCPRSPPTSPDRHNNMPPALPTTPPQTQCPRSPTRSPDRNNNTTPNLGSAYGDPQQQGFAPRSPMRTPVIANDTTTSMPAVPPQTQYPRSPTMSPDRHNNTTPERLLAYLDADYGQPLGFESRPPLRVPVIANDTTPTLSPSYQAPYNATNSNQPQPMLGISPPNESSTLDNTQYIPDGIPPDELLRMYQAQLAPLAPTSPYTSNENSIVDLENETEASPQYRPSLNQNLYDKSRSSAPAPPAEVFVDLTDESPYDQPVMRDPQCGNESMDTSGRNSPIRGIHTETWQMRQEDMGDYQNPSANRTFRLEDLLDPEFNYTPRKTLNRSCPADPQAGSCPPRASLFKCLAQKLSSTYNFLTSFIKNSNPQPQQDCAEPQQPSSGQNACPYTTINDSTYGLDRLFETQHNPNASTTYGLDRLFETQYKPNASTSSCPYTTNNDSTYGLDRLFETQYKPNASTSSCPYTTNNDSTYGLDHLFETQHNPYTLTVTPGSRRECANAKRCGRVQFDSADTPQDPKRNALHKAQMETLVDDTFCPGLIQGTIDGQENFNNHAFNIVLGSDARNSTQCGRPPSEEPMSLLEAFAARIEQEREKFNEQLSNNVDAEQIEDLIAKQFANKFPTDLNRSIQSLLLSEGTKEKEQVEQAKDKSFESDVQKLKTKFPENPKISLDVYTGNTKPTD